MKLYLLKKQKPKGFLLMVLLLFCFGTIQAQKLTVKGSVTDAEDKSDLPGVSILIKGTGNGTISDFDGTYSLKAKKGAVLVFSFIGYTPQEISVTNEALNVALSIDSKSLEEVVIIGYGTQKKKVVTGAVARVQGDDLTKVIASDVGNSLQGMVAGVNVTANSGQPGEGSSILIRGFSSLTGDNTPLYIVDNVPQEGDPRLSPNEIETIDILKDAASCAIYGSRGAAGVILITTKRGKAGKLKVRVNTSVSLQDIRSGTPLMTAEEQTYSDMLKFRNGATDDDMVLFTLRNSAYFQNNTDLSKVVFNDFTPIQNYNINLSGGNNGMTYSLTGGYYSNKGVVINSNFERFNTRANIGYKADRWDFNASVGFAQEKMLRSPAGIIGQAIKYNPLLPTLNPDNDSEVQATSDNEALQITWVLDSFQNEDISQRSNTFGNFSANYRIIDGLTLSTQVGIQTRNEFRHRFNPYTRVVDNDGDEMGNRTSSSNVIYNTNRRYSATWNTGLTYQKSFGNNNMTIYAGQTLEKYTFDNIQASKDGVNNNLVKTLNGAESNTLASSPQANYVNKLVGTIARVQYDYDNKYLFSGSVRRDGSSRFNSENTWGTFPSVSAGWNISEENFWKQSLSKTVNTFKLRASYGEVGNQNFAPYSYSTTIANGIDYSFDGSTAAFGYSQTSYANKKVKWETTIQSNLGIDLGLFDNKVTLSAEYYNTKKSDMLTPVASPSSAGALPSTGTAADWNSQVILNVGNMINRGVELSLGYKTKIGAANFNITGTFSTNHSEVTKLSIEKGILMLENNSLVSGSGTQVSRVNSLAVGYEPASFFIFETDGVITTDEDVAKYGAITNNGSQKGDLIYKDQLTEDTDGDGIADSGDGVIDINDRVYKGSGLPDYEIGLTVGANYKNFDFSMRWYAALGHEIMNGAKATAYGWGRHKDLTSQWSAANSTSTIPTYRDFPNRQNNYRGDTDLWLEDGSFLRLKQISIGYSLPKSLLKNAGIGNVRVYISAQNLFTLTNYEGYDPEVGGNLSSKGLDRGNYPITSMYTAGFNLNF